jgi:tetratricopeptide (TPR) repeat protein
MSLIAEALRRAQQLKLSNEKTGAQNRISDDILLGSEIVVDKASRKMSLSKTRFTVFGVLVALMVVAVFYNLLLFREPSILKGEVPPNGTSPTAISIQKVETPSEKLTTLDTPQESIVSKPEKIVTAKLSPGIDHEEQAPDHLTPRKSPPTWQAKNKLASVGDTFGNTNSMPLAKKQDSASEGARIYPDLGASDRTANQTQAAPEEYGGVIASAPLQVGFDKNRSEQNHNNLGVTYYLRGDLERALEEFKTAIQLDPNNIESFVNLGIVYKKQNKFQHALKAYERAISLKPTSPDPYYNLAILYDDTRDFTSAAKAYERFLNLTPGKYHPQKQKVQERLNLIQTYIK